MIFLEQGEEFVGVAPLCPVVAFHRKRFVSGAGVGLRPRVTDHTKSEDNGGKQQGEPKHHTEFGRI